SNFFTPYVDDNFNYDGQQTYNYGMSWVTDSWNPNGGTAWMSGWGGIKLFTAAAPRLAITGSGNVGIGTIAPSTGVMLHIKSNNLTYSNASLNLETNSGNATWQLTSIQTTANFAIIDASKGRAPFVID